MCGLIIEACKRTREQLRSATGRGVISRSISKLSGVIGLVKFGAWIRVVVRGEKKDPLEMKSFNCGHAFTVRPTVIAKTQPELSISAMTFLFHCHFCSCVKMRG